MFLQVIWKYRVYLAYAFIYSENALKLKALGEYQISRGTCIAFPTSSLVRPAKTRISLRIS